MKALLVIAICLSISACLQSGGGTDTTYKSNPADGSDDTGDSGNGTPTWTAPATSSEAEQEFRGTYKEQNKPSNVITVNSNFTASGSSDTTYLFYVSVANQWIDKPTTCSWSLSNLRAQARQDGKWDIIGTVVSSSSNANDTVKDCVKQPTQQGLTETSVIVRYVSQACVGITFAMSSGEKVYCKE